MDALRVKPMLYGPFGREKERIVDFLPMFKDQASQTKFDELYDKCLKLWPVPYKTIRVETKNGNTNVIECGDLDKPVLVLFHGVSATSLMWVPNIQELSKYYHLYAIDTLGDIGRSFTKEPFRNKKQAAEWVNDILQKMGIKKPNIIGMSYGSFLALNYSLHYRDNVHRLIMVSPTDSFVPLRMTFWLKFVLVMLFPLKKNRKDFMTWTNGNVKVEENDFTEMVFLGMSKAIYRFPATGTIFSKEELSSIDIETLILIGENEVLVDIEKLQASAKSAMKSVKIVVIKSGSHTVCSEKPADVNREIIKFLNEHQKDV